MDSREILIERLNTAANELARLEADDSTSEAAFSRRRALSEDVEDLLDRLNPGAAIPPPPPTDALAADGLAIVVGHSSEEQGAKGLIPPFPSDNPATPTSENHEYAWNTDLALRIEKRANRAGIRCGIFFRDGVGIEGAYANVRNWSPKVTVELHFNSFNGTARGTEVLFGTSASKAWATALQDGMVALFARVGNLNRGLKIPEPGGRGHRSANQLHPSALIEPFFGDVPSDAQLGVSKKDALADAVLAAFARLTGVSLPSENPGADVTITPEPTMADIPDVPLFRELIATYRTVDPVVPGLSAEVVARLKAITLAQWIEETGWARSELASEHFNFAGMKGISEVAAILRDIPATTVLPCA